MHGVEGARLIGVDGGKLPVADEVLHEPVAVLEVGHVVHRGQGEAIAVIEGRTGALGGDVLEVLHAAGRGVGGENFGRGVVDIVAPGVSAHELEAIVEAAGDLVGEAVVGGGAHGHEAHDVVVVEAGVHIGRHEEAAVVKRIDEGFL